MGGRDVNNIEFTHPFEYDPGSNSWTTKSATYPDNHVNNMACSVLNDSGTDYIYCAGGSEFTGQTDRKSTRLNSSHSQISYAVFCLKKKKYAHIKPNPHETTSLSLEFLILFILPLGFLVGVYSPIFAPCALAPKIEHRFYICLALFE